ncbi:MAG: hypothetical protein ACP5N2_01895 [Candidatus Nanoarchaeia archaeon]
MSGTIELVSEEQVLSAVKSNGPVVPMDVRAILKAGDSIIIGATLSTLSARGLVKITSIKRGGSPFYYLPGQEEKLSDLSKYLGEKDRRTFDLLKQKKAMRDKEEEPLIRVSLRNLPDFAKRIDVEVGTEQEIFWKWYLITDDEAISILSRKSQFKKPEVDEDKESKTIVDVKSEEREKTTNVKEEIKSEVKEDKKEKSTRKKKEKASEQDSEQVAGVEQQLLTPLSSQGQVQSSISNFNDAFINKAARFLESGGINIKDSKQIKKSVEYDLIIEIPTSVGNIEYFCKVKGKKKCSEADLSSAYVQGQGLRLPVLFLTTGEVVKKAKEKLKTDFKGMIVKEI